MTEKITTYLKNNWLELKGKIKGKWSELTDNDLLKIEGSYDQLIGKLTELYGDKIENIEDEVSKFLKKHGFKSENIKEAYDNANSIKEKVFNYMGSHLENLSNKSFAFEKQAEQCVKNHPITWLGIAALGGFIVAKLIDFKSSQQ